MRIPMRSMLLLIALLGHTALFAQKTYTFTSVPGDPLQARIYTWRTACRCG
jgi:hypothetical protein